MIRNLSEAERVIGAFAPHRICSVHSLLLNAGDSLTGSGLNIVFVYGVKTADYLLRVHFSGVQQLQVTLLHGPLQLLNVFIRDVSCYQLEGIRYEFGGEGTTDHSLRFRFSGARLISVAAANEPDVLLWSDG